MSDIEKYFIFKSKKGLANRIGKLPYVIDQKIYNERLDYEISIIAKMNYQSYFLVVQDFINWAKRNNILVGDGRGSGAGSLCAFALGITNVDPIKYDLYFERFLNPARVSMPDFDIDFQKDRRDEVIQYVRQKYGEDNVAQISTFGTFKAKKSIKDIARTLGYSLNMANELCKLYPKPVHGKEVKLKEAFEKVDKLRILHASDTDEGRILRWAEKIEGRVASFGIHASGIVIASEPISKIVPLAKGKNDEVVTQWDMVNIEDVGLIKFDFLGLKTLSQIATTLKLIKQKYNTDIDLINLPLDDSEVYSNLRKGDNIGIFQLEGSSGIRDLTIKVRPTCIEDIAAINAMYRPGPLGSDQMQVYLNWKAGQGDPLFHHKDLKPILGETGGWLVYQEQVLRIARDMAGYTLAEADLLRRAVGKKKAQEMAEQKTKLLAGFKKNNYPDSLGETLWDEIVSFADYGFNKSIDKDTKISTINGNKSIENFVPGDRVFTIDKTSQVHLSTVISLHDHGQVPMWEVKFTDGTIERCTLDHKWLTEYGQQPLWKILEEDLETFGLDSKRSGNRLANIRSEISQDKNSTLWSTKSDDNKEPSESSKNLSGMSKTQEDYSSRNQNQKQPISEDERNSFCNSQEDFSSQRYSESKSSNLKELEEFSSRRIFRNTKESSFFSQEVKDGNVFGTTPKRNWFRKKYPAQMWRSNETGRLCKSREENSDRNRWTMAFLTGEWSRETSQGSTKRPDIRTRNNQASGLDLNKIRYDELQFLWGHYKLQLARAERLHFQQNTRCLQARKVLSIKYLGLQQAYDLEVDHPDHNFVLESGLCSSNSHAVGYAITTYKTAWLKTHYPVEFMAAALTCDTGKQDQMIIYIQECRRMGIPVLPPDVNESGLDFTPVNGSIRFGLSAIKNVGDGANAIIAEREARGPFKNFFEFAERINLSIVNKKKLESLVSAGAFDFTHQNRATLLLACDQVIEYKDDLKKFSNKLETYNKKLEAYQTRELDIKAGKLSETNKPLKSLKIPEIPIAPTKPDYIIGPEIPLQEILQAEKELTGFFISGHPLDNISKPKKVWTIQKLREDTQHPEYTTLMVIISDIQLKEIKDKKRMAFLKFEDLTGTIEGVIFPGNYNKYVDQIIKNVPILLGAKVDYVDIENEDGELTTIPSLIVQGIELVGSGIVINKEILQEIPLDIPSILGLKKTLDKIGTGDEQLRLKFTSKSGTILSPNKLIGISNERTFRTAFHKQIRR